MSRQNEYSCYLGRCISYIQAYLLALSPEWGGRLYSVAGKEIGTTLHNIPI